MFALVQPLQAADQTEDPYNNVYHVNALRIQNISILSTAIGNNYVADSKKLTNY